MLDGSTVGILPVLSVLVQDSDGHILVLSLDAYNKLRYVESRPIRNRACQHLRIPLADTRTRSFNGGDCVCPDARCAAYELSSQFSVRTGGFLSGGSARLRTGCSYKLHCSRVQTAAFSLTLYSNRALYSAAVSLLGAAGRHQGSRARQMGVLFCAVGMRVAGRPCYFRTGPRRGTFYEIPAGPCLKFHSYCSGRYNIGVRLNRGIR